MRSISGKNINICGEVEVSVLRRACLELHLPLNSLSGFAPLQSTLSLCFSSNGCEGFKLRSILLVRERKCGKPQERGVGASLAFPSCESSSTQIREVQLCWWSQQITRISSQKLCSQAAFVYGGGWGDGDWPRVRSTRYVLYSCWLVGIESKTAPVVTIVASSSSTSCTTSMLPWSQYICTSSFSVRSRPWLVCILWSW